MTSVLSIVASFSKVDVVDFLQFATGDFIRLVEQPFGFRSALRENLGTRVPLTRSRWRSGGSNSCVRSSSRQSPGCNCRCSLLPPSPPRPEHSFLSSDLSAACRAHAHLQKRGNLLVDMAEYPRQYEQKREQF